MCTGVKVITNENHCFWGRTSEFDVPVDYKIIVLPRGYKLNFQTPGEVKYGTIGVEGTLGQGENIKGECCLYDGVNEKGLSGGTFAFGVDNRYGDSDEIIRRGKKPLLGEEFFTWILTRYSSVQEIKDHLNEDIAVSNKLGALGVALPQHCVFHDTTGASIVVEPTGDCEFKIFDNPIGVITNNPDFEFHMTNLRNYVGLSNKIDKAIKVNGQEIASAGRGSGLFGIPGDFTPQSRFVRAAVLSSLADQPDDSFAPALVFHLLNTADIPKGAIEIVAFNSPYYTQYTSAYDCERKIIYYHNYYNRCIQKVDLTEEDMAKDTITRYQIQMTEEIIDLRKASNNSNH